MQKVVVIGAGPAGLMAAEVLSSAGVAVEVYDAMPSVGRKFLLAGKGGLNLTHSEPKEVFVTRYGPRSAQLGRMLQEFDADAVRRWAGVLGIDTFVGTSGRVFPTDMKAAPLLRAWLHRLRQPAQGVGVQFFMRHRWTGQAGADSAGLGRDVDGKIRLHFDGPSGRVSVQSDAVVLALGGGSWARLGSDGAWVPWLEAAGVDVAPLLPANCGFDVEGGWSAHFASKFAGLPFKSVAIALTTSNNVRFERRGEFVATATGVEGSLVYAASGLLRDDILAHGKAQFSLDLLPDFSPERVLAEVSHPRGSRSLSSHLKSRLNIDGIKAGILYERVTKADIQNPVALAQAIKAVPLSLSATRPLDEAISSAGGVRFEALSEQLMLSNLPGVFCAGEMLDWEAPTGGYLMTGCMASGVAAAHGALAYLK